MAKTFPKVRNLQARLAQIETMPGSKLKSLSHSLEDAYSHALRWAIENGHGDRRYSDFVAMAKEGIAFAVDYVELINALTSVRYQKAYRLRMSGTLKPWP